MRAGPQGSFLKNPVRFAQQIALAQAAPTLSAHLQQLAAASKPETTPQLLTGDTPPQEPQGAATAIGELWKDFNILANYENPKKYPRGLDDILIYSLVRNAYVQHRLPVFMM
ncbi:MAG: hypothetical protein LBU43_09515 [Candidatus Accumulibacter sp.]|nr:hypothetical protein [Accumulibacter sp.]